jgi:hypothetical protein
MKPQTDKAANYKTSKPPQTIQVRGEPMQKAWLRYARPNFKTLLFTSDHVSDK